MHCKGNYIVKYHKKMNELWPPISIVSLYFSDHFIFCVLFCTSDGFSLPAQQKMIEKKTCETYTDFSSIFMTKTMSKTWLNLAAIKNGERERARVFWCFEACDRTTIAMKKRAQNNIINNNKKLVAHLILACFKYAYVLFSNVC